MRLVVPMVLAAILSAPAFAQTSDVAAKPVSIVTKTGQQVGLYKGSYALIIGESRYTAGWPNLESVPGEMTRLEAALKQQGFDVTRVNDADGPRLERAFKDFIGAHGYERDARLLFFYSGHGHTRQVGSQPKGYLVPSDAPNPRKDETGFLRKALNMDQIQTWAREIEAKHVLFLFDSCFSGTIFKSRALGDAPPDISAKTARPVRQFITAGSAHETVPASSVFLPTVIRALDGEADLDHDGYITGTELGEFLQKQVMGYRTGQTPQAGKIRDPDLDEGDFVFAVAKSAPPPPPGQSTFNLTGVEAAAQQEKANRQAWDAKLQEMRSAQARVEAVDRDPVSPDLKIAAWKQFLSAFTQKNPYSDEDQAMRAKANERLSYWQGEQQRRQTVLQPGEQSTQEVVRRALLQKQDTAEAYYAEGVKYFVNDDLDKAIRSFEATLALNPDHPQAKKDLRMAIDVRDKLRKPK